jgi:hypothetical protein
MPIIRCGREFQFEVPVSDEDYGFLLLFGHWLVTHPNKSGKKYVYQSYKRRGRTYMVWMHKIVVFRAHGPPPTPRHTIGDHLNGNSLHNRRCNLRWATHKMNACNPHGFVLKQRDLFEWSEANELLDTGNPG